MFRHLLLVTSLAAVAAPQRAEDLPVTPLPLRLTGTVTDPAPGRSACLLRCTDPPPRQGIFSPGQVACGVAVIEDIREDGIVIRNVEANRLEWLSLAKPADRRQSGPTVAEATSHPPPAAATSPGPVAVEVSKAAVERHLANLSEVLDSALAVPHYGGPAGARAVDGFELSRVKPEGAAHGIGLRDGDVVLEVNGQPLNGIPAVMQLLAEAPSLRSARLAVMRGGERLLFEITVR
jgi:type II secretory pathway component PulC